MKHLKATALLLALAMLLALAGCSGSSDSAAETDSTQSADTADTVEDSGTESDSTSIRTTDKTELVIGSDYEPTDLNYYESATDSQNAILAMVYDTMFTWDGDELVGSLIESYEYSGDDELDLILHVREGVTFSNGDTLTADDILFTMQKNMENLTTASRFTSVDIENSYVVDDNTVLFRLYQYDSTLLPYLATEYGRVLNAEYVQTEGEDVALAQTPVGTGPYVIESWESGTSLTLVKSETYWGGEEGQPFESIVFMFYSEDSIRSLEFEQGNLDIALLETSESVTRLSGREDEGIRISATTLTKEGYFCMSTIIDDDTFQDVNKRLAVAYALDIDAIVTAVAGSTAIAATSLIPSGSEGHVDYPYEYDPELAKEYLEKAGCPDGFTFTVQVANNQQLNLELAEAMQAYLAQVGIVMEIESLDFFTQFANMLAGEQLCGIMVGTANGDPLMALSAFDMGSGNCIAENHDETILNLIAAARSERDVETRMEYLDQLQEYMYEMAYCIPIYERVYTVAYQDYVLGLEDAGAKGENYFYANRLSFNQE